MRFVAKQPREGINVSDTHPLVEAGALIAGIGAICLIIALALIFLIEVALYFLPVEKEAQIFKLMKKKEAALFINRRAAKSSEIISDSRIRHIILEQR